MKIPKKAIDKALEQGWMPTYSVRQKGNSPASHAEIGFDPLFWKCLYDALNYKKTVRHVYERRITYRDGSVRVARIKRTWRGGKQLGWKGMALRFYDLILTGGDTEAYWNEVLGV